MSDTHTFREAVWQLFKSRPGQWIDGREIATVGGAYAWRTRISDCRKVYGATIENRIVNVYGQKGPAMVAKASQYRYLPKDLIEVAS
jgi:hypothetical protein